MNGFIDIVEGFDQAAIDALKVKADDLYLSTPVEGEFFSVDFSVHPVGEYTQSMQETDFTEYDDEDLRYQNHDGSNMIGAPGSKPNVTIVDDGGVNVLDILYVGGEFSYNGPSGLLLVNALPKNNRPAEDVNNPQEVTLEYKVKFVSGFDWGYGAKMLGLGGGLIPSGQQEVGGYNMENGFLCRHMWEVLWGSSRVPGIKPYLLHPGRSDEEVDGTLVNGVGPWESTVVPPTDLYFGDDTDDVNYVLSDDTWYTIKQVIRPNTPGNSDGYIKEYIDGVLAADIGGLKLIADGKAGDYTVDRLVFSTFYGGNSVDWGPAIDTHTRWKDITIGYTA